MKKMLTLLTTLFGILAFSVEGSAAIQCRQFFDLTKKGSYLFQTSDAKQVSFRIDGNPRADKIYVLLSGIDKSMSEWDRLLPMMLENDSKAAYVRIDLFGQGETGEMNHTSKSSIPYEAQVQLLREFIRVQGLNGKDITFISHSYGGAIATKFVQENPNLIRRNILIAPFVDNLEIHQPGIGPFYAWSKFMSEFAGLKGFYEASVGNSAALGTIISWPAYQAIRPSENKLSNVLALTEGVREVRMTEAISEAGTTETSIIYSGLDELIPSSGHLQLWKNVPETSQGLLLRIPATHESVVLNTKQVFDALLQLLTD